MGKPAAPVRDGETKGSTSELGGNNESEESNAESRSPDGGDLSDREARVIGEMYMLTASVFCSPAVMAAVVGERGPETQIRGEVSEFKVSTAATAAEALVGIVLPIWETVARGTSAICCGGTGDLHSTLALFLAGEQTGITEFRSGVAKWVGSAPRWAVEWSTCVT